MHPRKLKTEITVRFCFFLGSLAPPSEPYGSFLRLLHPA